jgi:hypothetical protein
MSYGKEYDKLKQTQIKLGSALACSFKKDGEMCVFVGSNATDDDVTSALIQLSIEVIKHRAKGLIL